MLARPLASRSLEYEALDSKAKAIASEFKISNSVLCKLC